MSTLTIAGREFSSRLFLGTGKFPSNDSMRDALAASGTQIVTVALRRADLSGKRDPYANILEFIDSEKYLLLPNTSGAMNAGEAVRLARLAAAAGLPKWVKLEIHPDPTYLLPDPIETLKALGKASPSCPTSTPTPFSPSACRKPVPQPSCR
jgi:thiazole synthase